MIHNVNTQIEEVCGVELPIGETLHIWKNRITPRKRAIMEKGLVLSQGYTAMNWRGSISVMK